MEENIKAEVLNRIFFSNFNFISIQLNTHIMNILIVSIFLITMNELFSNSIVIRVFKTFQMNELILIEY
jgi:hypothetical protein